MVDSLRTVLCVDDDADDREVVCYTINEIDPSIEVVHAENGEEAIEYLSKAKAEESLPCLVILDINMPKMDGRRTFLAIRSDAALATIPVIIFSTSSSPMDRLFFTAKNAAYFVKPVTVQQLLTIVGEMLDHCV